MGSIVGQIARTRPRFQAPYLLEFECENFGDGFLDITTFDGAEWLEVVCTDARHPDVREVLSTAILRSRTNKAPGHSALRHCQVARNDGGQRQAGPRSHAQAPWHESR
jgi:hypothetical protein